MPASDERPAELIQILNCDTTFIHVPMREEDVTLDAFFVRNMSEAEIQSFGNGQVWQIFVHWDELYEDHVRYKASGKVMKELERFKQRFPLSESIAA